MGCGVETKNAELTVLTTVRRVGNSLGITLSREAARVACMGEGTQVELVATPDGIRIRAVAGRVLEVKVTLPHSESELVAGMGDQSGYLEMPG
ncbi:MAG: hypothetical protein CVV05_00850 [Gammaproteobacteria bacterium HGW-Gammaproteobacteria-1]|jgi:antitoxin component of MazEF toxin-antitoxin module|nr:MAG: hypothetical protein CVV05_00850 [Gammaproteobacteria bacterium HGW-Gammaproteobacteria-1]